VEREEMKEPFYTKGRIEKNIGSSYPMLGKKKES